MRLSIALTITVLSLVSAPVRADTILLFGGVYDAETYVFCVDVSVTMSEEVSTIRDQLSFAIGQLVDAEFGIVAFGNGVQTFAPILLPPTPANLTAAQTWIDALDPSGPRCVIQGVQGRRRP